MNIDKKLLLEQQEDFNRQQHNAQLTISQQKKLIDRAEKTNEAHTHKVGVLQHKLVQHKTRIQILEEQLQLLRAHQFGKRSGKHPHPDQIQLFNEAEVVADEPGEDTESGAEGEDKSVHVPAHTRRRGGRNQPSCGHELHPEGHKGTKTQAGIIRAAQAGPPRRGRPGIEVARCRICGGNVRVIAETSNRAIQDRAIIDKILAHLADELPGAQTAPLPPVRAAPAAGLFT